MGKQSLHYIGRRQNVCSAYDNYHSFSSPFGWVLLLSLFLSFSPFTALADVIPCPIGWSEWSAQDDSNATRWCVKPQSTPIAPIDVSVVCAQIFQWEPPIAPNSDPNADVLSSPYVDVTPQAVSIRSDAENAWVSQLLQPLFDTLGVVSAVSLGGVAGFGDIVWHDQTKGSSALVTYTHFAPFVDWQMHSGCIAMQQDGFWRLVECESPQRPFVCTFPLSNRDDDNTTPTTTTTTTTVAPLPNTTMAPTPSSAPTRPPFPAPFPECLPDWTPHMDKCYHLFANATETGEVGRSQQLAQQHCSRTHPRASLTAIAQSDENAFVQQLITDWAIQQDYADVLAFVGGVFTSRGAIGVWYEDELWSTEAEATASAPSSPTWPNAFNQFYANWGTGEPSTAFGCVAVMENGHWYAEDCRSVMPYVCSYINDGSTRPPTPTSNNTDTTTVPANSSESGANESDSSSNPGPPNPDSNNTCVEGWTYFSVSSMCYAVLTDRSVAAADLEQRCGDLFPGEAPPDTIHAAAIHSAEESVFAGRLIAAAGVSRALIGAAYIDRGVYGIYLDGRTSWVPSLAESLWAAGQPARESGCVIVGPAGQWYHFPCGTPAAAHVCVYPAWAIHITPTTTPAPTVHPLPPPNTTEAPHNVTQPLEKRIAALSGAVHLVVTKGTVGLHTVTSAGGVIDGLLLLFAPDRSEDLLQAGWNVPPGLDVVSPCGGFKKQEYIFSILRDVVTVMHSNHTMRGRVCVSDNGEHYVPTGITFEVIDITLRGFTPLPSNSSLEDQDHVSFEHVGISLRSSGALQLDLSYDSATTPERRATASVSYLLHHLRLSSTPNCMHSRYALLAADLPVLSYRLSNSSTTQRMMVTYQLADMFPAPKTLGELDRLHDLPDVSSSAEEDAHEEGGEEEPPATEFTVCVAVSKRPLPRVSLVSPGVPDNDYRENNALWPLTSHDAEGHAVRLYTAVPNLRVYLTPPHVAVRGMWALPPFARNRHAVQLPTGVPSVRQLVVEQYASPIVVLDADGLREGMALLLSRGEGTCRRFQPTPGRDPTNPAIPEALDTMVAISVAPLSDPATQDTKLSNDTNNSSNNNSNSNSSSNNSSTEGNVKNRRVAFVMLNLNHTGMWGTDFNEFEQTWQLCFAYTPLSRFMPLPGLTLVVRRVNIFEITTNFDSRKRKNMNGNRNMESIDFDKKDGGRSDAGNRGSISSSVGGRSIAAVDMDNGGDAASAPPSNSSHEPFSDSLQLNINVGFSGVLNLWGLNVEMWSPNTLSTTEVAFARALPGNASIADPTFQCTNPSLFYRRRSLRIVVPRSTVTSGTDASASMLNRTSPAVVVIPPGFLREESSRRMRLCFSVPLPFHSPQRLFYPTAASVDVRGIEVHFFGPYAAALANSEDNRLTVVEVADNAKDVAFPLSGYGLSEDMTIFLTRERCRARVDSPDDEDDVSYVQRVSLVNFPIMRPYDVPRNYRRTDVEPNIDVKNSLFVTVNESLTAPAAANHIFGETRVPLFVCLHAPGTQRAIYPLQFKFVVRQPYVKSIRIAGVFNPNNETKEREAMGNAFENYKSNSASRGDDTAVVVYASFVDLIVEGFGLHEEETVFIPAINCSNATSFLWRSPVHTSSVPSMTEDVAYHVSSSRYVNPQTSMSSWFLSPTQGQTVRIGSEEPIDNKVERFQWCVRYRDVDKSNNTTTTDSTSQDSKNGAAADGNKEKEEEEEEEWTRGFVPAGIPYHLVIPPTDGFLFGDVTQKRITRKTRHPTLGMWEKIQLAGPLIDFTYSMGNSLFMFLAEVLVPCKKLKNYFINNNSSDRFITAVNGSAVLLPKLLTNRGEYKLCASAIYPERRASQEGTEAALQFFEIAGLRIELVDPVYAVFSLNGTDYITVEQGQEWTLPISGSSLSNRSIVRFSPFGTECSTPMPHQLDDVIVRNVFPGLRLFNSGVPTDPTNSPVDGTQDHYVVLEQDLIRGLEPKEYQLCFRPDRSTPWMTSAVVLHVVEHVRHPTYYDYFAEDGSQDVAKVTALPPTKVALDWLTHENDTANIVGSVAREVAVALWCLNGTTNTANHSKANNNNNYDTTIVGTNHSSLVPCGSKKRVIFVKPMDDDSDPCFVDFEAVQSDIIRGPYALDDGILTIPRSVSRNVSFYPNTTEPWVMCLETGPERWREPFEPLILLQFTTAFPVGFRLDPDDPSNSSATFFSSSSSSSTTDVGGEDGNGIYIGNAGIVSSLTASLEDRTGAEGNKTLVLHMEDSSGVFYLNGYGIQRGFKIRFGAHCEVEVSTSLTSLAPSMGGGVSSSNAMAGGETETETGSTTVLPDRETLVSEAQRLNNTRLYEEPLTIEDDHGVFLVPSSHFALLEAPTTMCLSTDGGVRYERTNLSLTVLPSRLRRDLPADESRLAELAFRRTLVVPRLSKGAVSLTEMIYADGVGTPSRGRIFATGTRVMLSSSCYRNLERLPRIVITTPDTLTLTEAHTRFATATGRLHICVRQHLTAEKDAIQGSTRGGVTVTDKDGVNIDRKGDQIEEEEDNDDSSDNSGGAIHGFHESGLFFRVLDVSVTSVSLHEMKKSELAESNGLRHMVVRRGNESMLLLVTMQSNNSNNTNTTSNSSSISPSNLEKSSSYDVRDWFLDLLDQPGALAFFGLARFRLGKPCTIPDPVEPEAVAGPYSAVTATFHEGTVRVTGNGGGVVTDFAVPLHTARGRIVEPWAPETLCFSVNGGRHYVSVGISYTAVSWAPTLRMEVDNSDPENEDYANNSNNNNNETRNGMDTPTYNTTDTNGYTGVTNSVYGASNEARQALSNVIHLFEQSSMYGRLVDARFDARGYNLTLPAPFADTPLNRLVGTFTADVLWTGFIGDAGYASGGELYIPAVIIPNEYTSSNLRITTTATTTTTTTTTTKTTEVVYSSMIPKGGELLFTVNLRHRNLSTGLHLWLEPLSLRCVGPSPGALHQQLHRQSTGWLLPISNACGRGLQAGSAVRLVDPNAVSSCANVTSVQHGFVFDARIVKLREWMGDRAAQTAPSIALQVPTAVRYVPDGRYRLCVQKYLPHDDAIRQGTEAVYVDTQVELELTSDLRVNEVSGLQNGTLGVFQGAEATLEIRGSVVPFARNNVRLAFSPATPEEVSTEALCGPLGTAIAVSSYNESGIYSTELTDHVNGNGNPSSGSGSSSSNSSGVTKDRLIPSNGKFLSSTATTATTMGTNKLMSGSTNGNDGGEEEDAEDGYVPYDVNGTFPTWHPSIEGIVTVPPSDLRTITNGTSFAICFSLDGGLSYRAAGEAPAFLRLSVRPPVLFGLSTFPPSEAEGNDGVESDAEAGEEGLDRANVSTPSAQRLVRFALGDTNITSHTARFVDRPPSYYYSMSFCFTGDGFGSQSGRQGWNASRRMAVALLFSDLTGEVCNGVNSSEVSAALATPIFLLNARTGCLWDGNLDNVNDTLDARNETTRGVSDALWKEWYNHTLSLRRNGGLFASSLFPNAASTRGRWTSVSILPCASLDGQRFYSSNAHLGRRLEEPQLAAQSPRPTPAPLRGLSRLPMALRIDPSTSGGLFARDVAVVVSLVVRPRGTNSSNISSQSDADSSSHGVDGSMRLNETAAALIGVQMAIGKLLYVDPAVLVLYLRHHGDVASPTINNNNIHSTTNTGQDVRLPTYTLSLSVLTDARVGNDALVTPAPNILLRYAALLQNITAQSIFFASFIPSDATGVEVVAPYVNFTLGNGVDLHALLLHTKASALPRAQEEVRWRNQMAAIAHATVVGFVVPDDPSNDPTSKASWWAVPLLLLFPICLILQTVYVYFQYLRYSPAADSQS